MNLKSAIESLRTELRKFTTQKQNFADYKLTDGTVVRVDGDLVAGTAVYVVTEEGTLPAPDGEHVVEGVGTIKTALAKSGGLLRLLCFMPVLIRRTRPLSFHWTYHIDPWRSSLAMATP